MSYIARVGPKKISNFGRWCYNLTGFNKYGLMHDDCLYEDDDVKEAVRRLPEDVRDGRNFRMMRALQLSLCKSILPKEQWTQYEKDVRYLEPYLEEVKREREEREDWNKLH
ncbi:cytochrome b-c1 complex subunit 7 [Culicoides brevitarsis]|uniref:cytochrome b-c1 complex subunit 7 n=1 Tax=Culicoides brevitarsis TaxID=469753 RepID=UPI00307C021F